MHEPTGATTTSRRVALALDEPRACGRESVLRLMECAPRVVIEETAASLGVATDDLFFEMTANERVQVFRNATAAVRRGGIRALARFVNPSHGVWTPAALEDAHADVCAFEAAAAAKRARGYLARLHFGGKTDTSPHAVDIFMMFVCGVELGVAFPSSADAAAMVGMVLAATGRPRPALWAGEDDPRASPRHALERVAAMRLDPSAAPLLAPRSRCEAVALAAALFGFDVSFCAAPAGEWFKLVGDSETAAAVVFSPIDARVRERVQRCGVGALCLTAEYNPLFRALYSAADAERFALRDGFEGAFGARFASEREPSPAGEITRGFDCAFDALDHAYDTQRVVRGWHPLAANSVSPYSLEPFADDRVVTFFGPSRAALAVSHSDLAALLRATRRFVVSGEGVRLALLPRVVAKLLRVAEEARDAALADALRATRDVDVERFQTADALVEEGGARVEAFFARVLRLGFAMRGWREGDPLPLEDAPPRREPAPEDDPALIIEVEAVRADPLARAPLINTFVSEGGGVRFMPAEGGGDPDTVAALLAEVARREHHIFACIRICSNYLITTAYYYLLLATQRPAFDIRRLQCVM